MEENTKSFLVKGLWIAIFAFVVRYFLLTPETIYDYLGAAGEAVSFSIIVLGLYEKFLWKYNPLEKVPKLSKHYCGTIEFNYNGDERQKDIKIHVSQSLLSTSVTIITDEIRSSTIASHLVKENGDYVLYYTYITNPRGKFCDTNPIQYGTCRLIVDNRDDLQGTYWTSRKTIGDMFLKPTEKSA